MEYEEDNKFNEEDFTTYLCETITQLEKDREPINLLFDQFYKDWRDFKDKKIYPWAGCANWSVPITSTAIDGITPRISENTLNLNPLLKAESMNKTSYKYKDMVNSFMEWDVKTHPDLIKEIWFFIQNAVIYGTAFNKGFFEKERGVKQRYIQGYIVNGELVKDDKGDIIEVSDIITQAYESKGIEYNITEVIEKTEGWKKYNPNCKTLNIKDVLFSSDAESIKDAWENGLIALKFKETKNDLKKRLKEGKQDLYRNLDKIKIKNLNENDNNSTNDEKEKNKQLAYKTKKLNFHEVYCNYDIDNDGLNEKVVAIIHKDSKTLLGYELYPYNEDKCNIVAGYIKPVHESVLGIGFSEMMFDIKREVESIHNARTDRNSLNNNKPLMHTDDSGFNPDIHKFGPGRNWELDSLSSEHIKFLDTPGNENSSQSEETLVFEYGQRRSGMFDNMAGKSDPKNKTATGILALIKEGNIPVRQYSRWISYAIGEILSFRWALYNQFWGEESDEEIEEWINQILDNPENPFKMENREAFRQNFNIMMTASQEDKEFELNKAQATYDIMLNNPVISQFPQALREFTVDLLRKVGHNDAEEKVPTIEEIDEHMIKVQQEAIRREMGGQIQPQGGNPNE
jgi:hypothetical protein